MTVLESHYGVNIVSTPNTLSGSPRIDDTRIGVYHLLHEAQTTDIDAAHNKYPHLTRTQIKAAFRFYENNHELLALEQRRHDDTTRWTQARHITCLCGETFPTPQELTAHIKHDGRYPVPEENAEHAASSHVFNGTINCTCDQTFDTYRGYLDHYDHNAWPPDPEHFIAYITID